MSDTSYLDELASKPLGARLAGYFRLSGPGYMQSAMTLGGGSVASCAALASLLGYELLWVQPVAMFLGYFILASVAKQTCHSGERSYDVFWTRLHPSLAILWAVSAFVATIIWHFPQYSLAANGAVALAEGAGLDWNARGPRMAIGAVLLLSATSVITLYHMGARGLRYYERAMMFLVWSIVISFAVVVFFTEMQWGRFFRGITGISFIQDVMDGGIDKDAVAPIVSGIAATVGINMLFLYPYTLLNKGWGKKHKELAYFDLFSGMAVPFILATGFMILAVSNTIGPAEGEVGASIAGSDQKMVRDIREIIPVLEPTFSRGLGETLGPQVARGIIGLGMMAIGFSTIITMMLCCGFVGCEMFRLPHKGKWPFIMALTPAIGVAGVVYPFPVTMAITASTLALPLMPVAVVCFIVLLNMKSYMGDERPEGLSRLLWNTVLVIAVGFLTTAAYFGMENNITKVKGLFAPTPAATATIAAPVSTAAFQPGAPNPR
jgi:Mn2+/Fe2+ NRAMP family transporter